MMNTCQARRAAALLDTRVNPRIKSGDAYDAIRRLLSDGALVGLAPPARALKTIVSNHEDVAGLPASFSRSIKLYERASRSVTAL